ncbi:MAG: carboxypeptidase regulatory-like domain-containing protein [Acidobacteria bacterium]|nr:carboxypeptidase regulatory-like domain-containing protein [Acidobacteriota bacterium]
MARIKFKVVFLAALLVVAFSATAFAQLETGQITGRITDPNGAVVPGAAVAVKSVETGAERTATADEEGVYSVTNLLPGLYDVSVTAQNFAKSTQRVQVTVGARASLDTQLSVTAIQGETVDVVAGSGVEVNTQTQELSTVVSGEQIRELPTITRNPYNLVQLSGNAQTDDPSTSQNDTAGTSTYRGAGASLNGQRAASTNILLDGADNNNSYTATVGQLIPLDSVQEFRVVTSNFSAEYGRASGGVVNVATRAGSNDFHGTAYAFNRISKLASNGFDNNAKGLERGVFARNQFGYSAGGRILRDKLFFFNSTEWIRVRSNGPVTVYVPTSELIAASAANTRAFFANYPLAATPTGRVSTLGDLGITVPGLASSTPAYREVAYTLPTDLGGGFPQNDLQTVSRIDWNLSDKTQVYGRYALQNTDLFEGTNANSPYQGFNTGTFAFNQNAMLSATHTFSQNLVSQSKLAFARVNTGSPLGEQPVGPTLYLAATRQNVNGVLVGLPGYLPFNPGSAIPAQGPTNTWQFYQDLNYQRGNHQFRFGGSLFYIQQNRSFGAFQNSVQTLGTNLATGTANLVAGQLFNFRVAVDPQGHFPGQTATTPLAEPSFIRYNRYNEWAAYFNDAWRARPGLTLNLGLRYEYFGVQHNKFPELDSNFYFGSGSTLQERIRNGSVQVAGNSPVGGLWAPDKNNFAPRVGFAWDVTGDGRTSLRGGYGVSYERNFGNVTFNVIQNPPSQAVISITAGTTPGFASIPLSLNNLGPVAGSGQTIRLPETSLRHVREDIRNAYAHFWSAAFEREMGRGTVASVEYSGSAGRSLYSLENINRQGYGPVYLGGNATTPTGGSSSRLNGQYGDINSRGNNGYSNYNALIVGMESNNFRNKGLQFTARYTFSSAKDNLSSTFSDANYNYNLGLLDPFDPKLDYGYADFDARHRFTSSFAYEVPYFGGGNGVARQLLGGWTLTGIFNARTGNPFTVWDCTTGVLNTCTRFIPGGALSLSGDGNPPTSRDASGRPVANSFDLIPLPTSVLFTNPIAHNGAVGPFPAEMTRRNAFRGPGYWNMDAGLYKRIRFNEKYSLQLRFEAFNVFNHANLFVDVNNLDASGTNAVTALRGVFPSGNLERRNVQLAAKFVF